MPRWVVVVVLLLCPDVAHADATLEAPTGVSIQAEGPWERQEDGGGGASRYWYTGAYQTVAVAFSKFDEGSCGDDGDGPEVITTYLPPEIVAGYAGFKSYDADEDGVWTIVGCVEVGEVGVAGIIVSLPRADYLLVESLAPVREVIRDYAEALHAAGAAAAPVETRSLYLPTLGLSIVAPTDWTVEGDDDQVDTLEENGDFLAAVTPLADGDCPAMLEGFAIQTDRSEFRSSTSTLPGAWTGVEFRDLGSAGDWFTFACHPRPTGVVVIQAPLDAIEDVVAALEAALNPPAASVEVGSSTEPSVEPSVEPTDGGAGGGAVDIPVQRRKAGVIGGILPRSVQLGLVRRADAMGSGFGFGLQLGRMGWREHQQFTIGYEVAAAAASGFWELSAQVRPSLSPDLEDLPVDAYLALGVDVLGGKHQPDTDVAPVGGVGAEAMFPLPGVGVDLAGQVLADPGGFHSYTLHGGLLFGTEAKAKFRLGMDYVRRADDSTVMWFTLGLTAFELD